MSRTETKPYAHKISTLLLLFVRRKSSGDCRAEWMLDTDDDGRRGKKQNDEDYGTNVYRAYAMRQ